MSNAELRDIQMCVIGKGCGGLNGRIDSFLRSIFGNFKLAVPRNWIGPAPPGSWSVSMDEPNEIRHNRTQALFHMLLYLFAGWVFISTVEVQIALFYAFILVAAGFVFVGEAINPTKSPLAYIGWGDLHKIQNYLTVGIVAAVVSIIGMVALQSVVPMQIGLAVGTSVWFILFVGLIYVPTIEEVGFRSVALPTIGENLGIIPGLVISSIIFGLFHLVLFQEIALVLGSVFFGFVMGIITLREGSSLPAIIAHIIIQIVASIPV